MTHDWPIVPLAKVAKPISRPVPVIAGESYRTIGVKWWGEGAYERETIDGSRTAAKTLSLVCEGDLIINKIWVRHGSTAIATKVVDGCAASGEFPTFELDQSRVFSRWIHWQTKTRDFWAKCDALSRGKSGKNRIKPELFLTIEVPLPPLDEQRRLVARIEALAAKIEEARSLRRLAVEEAEALQISSWRNIFAAAERDGWRNYTVEECCEAMIDYRGRTPPISDAGIPHLTSANIKNGRIDWNTSKFVSEETYAEYMTRGIPRIGDVIFTMEAPLGEAAVIVDERRFSLAQRTLLLRPDTNIHDGAYLAKVIKSPQIREVIFANATGTTVKGIASKRLKNIKLPIPPREEQHRIVAYLDGLQGKVDALKALQAQTQSELDALLPSVLDKAFKGEL